eukprot:scaffold18716_cov28-Phaeocystis_antarctica.AAC.1
MTAEGARLPAALRVRFFRTACPACWLLDVSRLIAFRMVFQAQGESPTSCARELGPEPGRTDAATHTEENHSLVVIHRDAHG